MKLIQIQYYNRFLGSITNAAQPAFQYSILPPIAIGVPLFKG